MSAFGPAKVIVAAPRFLKGKVPAARRHPLLRRPGPGGWRSPAPHRCAPPINGLAGRPAGLIIGPPGKAGESAPAAPGPGDPSMRIHSIEAIAVEIPLTQNFGGSTYAVLKRSTVVTRLRTDDGPRQRGLQRRQPRARPRDRPPDPGGAGPAACAARASSRASASGSELFALHATPAATARRFMEAIACVDCAVWDLVGKALGQSVRELLGGYRGGCRSSRSAATTWRARRSPTSAARWRATARPAWPAASSRSGGLTPEEDAERVEAARRRRGARLRPRGRRQPRLDRRRRGAVRAARSSRSTSAGSRSRATGTTTRR